VISPKLIKASVIIPVYNNPHGLKKVLASLVEQDFPKDQYEIIVADNCSTDESLDVVHEYAENYPNLVKCVIEDKIQSSYAARNKGINTAKGSILAFTDSDCDPDGSWLMEGCKSLKQNNASMVAGEIEFTFKNSKPNIWEYFDAAGKLNQKSYVENAGFGATANLFVQKRMFDKYGLFLPELQSGGDYEFGRRLTQSGEVLLFSETALVYHPARSKFRSKLAKSKRIAEGQKKLARMGLLNHGELNWRQLFLTPYYPTLPKVKMKIHEKILLILINNYFRYYNFFKRL
jgi:glycosyltransferase involved in cell wall biosynthesis